MGVLWKKNYPPVRGFCVIGASSAQHFEFTLEPRGLTKEPSETSWACSHTHKPCKTMCRLAAWSIAAWAEWSLHCRRWSPQSSGTEKGFRLLRHFSRGSRALSCGSLQFAKGPSGPSPTTQARITVTVGIDPDVSRPQGHTRELTVVSRVIKPDPGWWERRNLARLGLQGVEWHGAFDMWTSLLVVAISSSSCKDLAADE